MVALFQIPLWIVLSHSYRNLARVFPDPTDPMAICAHEQLKSEGTLWFGDLTVPDPTGMLPVMTALINLTIIQVVSNDRRKQGALDSMLIKLLMNGGRLLSLAMIPFGLVMPADMCLYWTVSSSIGLVQNLILINPKAKTFLKIQKPKKS